MSSRYCGVAFYVLLAAGCSEDAPPAVEHADSAGLLNALSLEDIILRHVEARGGAEALDAIESVRTRVRITEPNMSIVADYRATQEGEMRVDIYAGDERVFSEGLDSEGAWQRGQGATAETREVSPAGAAALRHGIELNLFALHRFAERGHSLELDGRELIDDVDYHVLEVTLLDGFETYFYIHPDTWRLERQRDIRALHPDIDREERLTESIKTEFREHCGVLWVTGARQIDMVTGEEVQRTEVLEQSCNEPAHTLQIPRDETPAAFVTSELQRRGRQRRPS